MKNKRKLFIILAIVIVAMLIVANLWHRHVYGIVVNVSETTINDIKFDTLLIDVKSAGVEYQFINLHTNGGSRVSAEVGDRVLSIINTNILTSDPPEVFSIWSTVVRSG